MSVASTHCTNTSHCIINPLHAFPWTLFILIICFKCRCHICFKCRCHICFKCRCHAAEMTAYVTACVCVLNRVFLHAWRPHLCRRRCLGSYMDITNPQPRPPLLVLDRLFVIRSSLLLELVLHGRNSVFQHGQVAPHEGSRQDRSFAHQPCASSTFEKVVLDGLRCLEAVIPCSNFYYPVQSEQCPHRRSLFQCWHRQDILGMQQKVSIMETGDDITTLGWRRGRLDERDGAVRVGGQVG